MYRFFFDISDISIFIQGGGGRPCMPSIRMNNEYANLSNLGLDRMGTDSRDILYSLLDSLQQPQRTLDIIFSTLLTNSLGFELSS